MTKLALSGQGTFKVRVCPWYNNYCTVVLGIRGKKKWVRHEGTLPSSSSSRVPSVWLTLNICLNMFFSPSRFLDPARISWMELAGLDQTCNLQPVLSTFLAFGPFPAWLCCPSLTSCLSLTAPLPALGTWHHLMLRAPVIFIVCDDFFQLNVGILIPSLGVQPKGGKTLIWDYLKGLMNSRRKDFCS